MRKLAALLFSLLPLLVFSQNVGIGTTTPQQKLHVAGNIRADGLAGLAGVVVTNGSGDLVSLPNSGNSNQALRGDGVWGFVPGTLSTGAIVGSIFINDSALISRGFSLYGSLPSFNRFSTFSNLFPANSWSPTYVDGNANKGTPPIFDGNDIMFWNDSVLLVLTTNEIHSYNPITDVWKKISSSHGSFAISIGAQSFWTGTELIVWGGFFNNATNNGFRYNPTTNSYRSISTLSQPTARRDFAMYVAGNKLVVWGGAPTAGGTEVNTGGIYDLVSETWVATSLTGVPEARKGFCAVLNSNNQTVLIWGGRSIATTNLISTGAILNPVANSWTPISTTNAPSPRELHSGVWSGTEMLVFGGNIGVSALQFTNTGYRYNPISNSWTVISSSSAPTMGNHGAIWDGSKMMLAGGIIPNTSYELHSAVSYFYDPIANTWTSAGNMPINILRPTLTLADNMILAFGSEQVERDSYTGVVMNRPASNKGGRYFRQSVNASQTLQFSGAVLYLYRKN